MGFATLNPSYNRREIFLGPCAVDYTIFQAVCLHQLRSLPTLMRIP
jgi:hypothetical protein